ncbi:MAG TPA: prolipoprotein diacylglyceryl transferase family protein [Opitutaceae bacterium]|nr:prolipoprotein diacylglyceryl transferase family protein [Opitutaceae bacterium]
MPVAGFSAVILKLNGVTFPFYFEILGLRLHPHVVFETIAYAVGARLYFFERRRLPAAAQIPLEQNLWLLVGCIFGAWGLSKLLAWGESPEYYWSLRTDPRSALLGGKTIVGGLLGGWIGVELAKKRLGITRSAGDAFVLPLTAGIAIGRIGCFLTGLPDRTYGLATSLPWGVDFGDHVHRHPTQLYESLFVLALGTIVLLAAGRARPAWPAGRAFRLFLLGYFAFRLVIEFIKPREPLLGPLSAIQLASLIGVVFCFISLRRACPTAPTSTPS